MVALNGLLLATFFVVGRVIAAPFPGGELSVTTSESRGIKDIAIDTRSLRSVTEAAIEVRKDKPKTTTPTKKPAKTTPKKPTKEPAKKPGKPKSCPPKRPRGLKRRYMEPGKDASKVNEHQFVISKSSATVWNLSGCTAVFFWNFSKTPSAFHILCGSTEKADGKTAANYALEGSADSYFTIVAAKQSTYNNVLAGIKETFAEFDLKIRKEGEKEKDGEYSIVQLDSSFYVQKPGMRTKITATKGTTKLTTGWDDVSECSVQGQ